MASPGVGTPPHVFGELFNMMTGVDLVHVPYRSNFYPDLLSGQVQVIFATAKMQTSLAGIGVTPMSTTPAEFGKFIADETEKWTKVVKFAGINPV